MMIGEALLIRIVNSKSSTWTTIDLPTTVAVSVAKPQENRLMRISSLCFSPASSPLTSPAFFSFNFRLIVMLLLLMADHQWHREGRTKGAPCCFLGGTGFQPV